MPHSTLAKPITSSLTEMLLPTMMAQDRPLGRESRHINSLPWEVLEHILSHAVVRQEEDREWCILGHGATNVQRKAAPFRLASVCQRWREIMLGYGALWSYVSIPAPTTWSQGVQAAEFLGIVLRRSGVSTLSVLLPWDHQPEPAVLGNIKAMALCIEVLCQHSHRWDRFEFRGPACTFSNRVAQRLYDCPTPALRRLWMSYGRHINATEAAWPPLPRTLLKTTSLVAAALILEHCASFDRPMPYLSDLELDIPAQPTGLYALLSKTPNLTRLTLTGIASEAVTRNGISPYTPQTADRISLDSLRYLSVVSSALLYAIGTLTRTTLLPNLAEIHLPWTMAWFDGQVPALVSFFKMHGGRITSLTFHEDRSRDWWKHLSDQDWLRFREHSTELLWARLSESNADGEWILPRLQVLSFKGLLFFPGGGEVFRMFSELRCKGLSGASDVMDVYWLPADDPDACDTYDFCTDWYQLPLSWMQWCDLLQRGSRARRSDTHYFCASEYLRTNELVNAF